jgi:hypothetical protein
MGGIVSTSRKPNNTASVFPSAVAVESIVDDVLQTLPLTTLSAKPHRISNATISTASPHSTPNASEHRLSGTLLFGNSSLKFLVSKDREDESSDMSNAEQQEVIDIRSLRAAAFDRHPFQDYTFGKKLGE